MYDKCKYKLNTIEGTINTRGVNVNNTIITLRTSEEIKQKLDMLALKENRSLNNYIVTILIKHIEQIEKKESENE